MTDKGRDNEGRGRLLEMVGRREEGWGVGGDYIAGRRKGWEGLNGSKLVNWGHRDKGWTCKLSWV